MMIDKIALIDLDATLCDYDADMAQYQRTLQDPAEAPYTGRYGMTLEPPHMEARRKLIQRMPGFWRNLKPIKLGFDVVRELRALDFNLHVLTKGPMTTSNAWAEKVDWCREHIPDALVTVSSDKSLVYGRVLFDDFPPYFSKWLAVRPRGLVVCLPYPWNEGYANGQHPNVFRYDGTNLEELKARLRDAFDRKSGA